MSRAGIIIGTDGSSIEHDTIWDSRLTKLTVNPDADPPHFDLIPDLPGGTAFSIPSNDTIPRTEILFKVKHNLPFKPDCLAFFYPIKVPSSFNSNLVLYSQNRLWMIVNAIGMGIEYVWAEADTQYFYIKHLAQSDGTFASGHDTDPKVFFGNAFHFRVRYFIFNQPSHIIDGGEVQNYS